MIKIKKDEVVGWEHAIRGMRNPLNSWDRSDSYENYLVDYKKNEIDDITEIRYPYYRVGAADISLMYKLSKTGTDHRKFMRMITVYVDVTAPLYWWKEYDTYKIGTVANSCSTMHKIADKEFTLDDFSHEHLFDDEDNMAIFKSSLNRTIADLNTARDLYLNTKDKKYWWQMIQLLPTSYNQKRTLMLNYEVLANIYKSRKNHKLDEWKVFCKWIEALPYSEIITSEPKGEDNN